MNKTTEALKLAEEALDKFMSHPCSEHSKALAAIREALADHSGDANEMVYSKPSVFDGVCCGCSKKAADGYALYCIECWEKSNGDPFAASGKPIDQFRDATKMIAEPVNDLAYREAARLAKWLFKKHYASDECYAAGRVVWGLCDTTAGIISQIDNMVCCLVKPAEPVKQEPVAWVINTLDGITLDWDLEGWKPIGKPNPLYAAPVDAKAIRAEALEEAAKRADAYAYMSDNFNVLAAEIRGLK